MAITRRQLTFAHNYFKLNTNEQLKIALPHNANNTTAYAYGTVLRVRNP